mmetsp:Transcript_26890/g.43500  ORF Transcript_26890/g.43500 Transcript_26890/m.43500 type:complete len:549 (+) Transcript_26890:253-1899(+)
MPKERQVGMKTPPVGQKSESRKKQKRNESPVKKDEAKKSKFRESGIIVRVDLEQFLCHTNFGIDFHPNINFIHGTNGSGKSAIIAAIQTCMDSRASETHRARSIKQLIQNGKDWARIKVTLKNEGDEAYKPETYGKRIVIQRELNRHSAHKYSLISERGKIISNRREDLDKILHHFSIKVTNPCVLLTQDDARDLIGGTDPRKMYEFFLRATGLREMKDDISAIQSKVDSMERMIESENIKIKDFELKAAEAEKEYKTCEHIQDLDNKLLKTRKMLLWSKVGEFEEELSELESNLEKVSKRKEQYSQQLAQQGEIDQKSLNRKMKDQMTGKLKKLVDLKNQLTQEVESKRETLRSTTDHVMRIMPRPEGKFPSRTKLVRKKQALQKQLEREKRKHGDFFVAEVAYDKAVKDLKEANEDLRLSRELLEKEKEIYKDRRENWKDSRSDLQTLVNLHFNCILTRQGYYGQLVFDDKEKELTIEAIPAHQEETAVTKALSEGEKSFTIIAFILAFSDLSLFDAPFRAMDVFDIFMVRNYFHKAGGGGGANSQ